MYYFILYRCIQHTRRPDGSFASSSEHIFQDVIANQHPLVWQIESNEKYGTLHDSPGGYKKSEEYLVLNWKELTEEEYLQIEGDIG